jgi:hypothetical protein
MTETFGVRKRKAVTVDGMVIPSQLALLELSNFIACTVQSWFGGTVLEAQVALPTPHSVDCSNLFVTKYALSRFQLATKGGCSPAHTSHEHTAG